MVERGRYATMVRSSFPSVTVNFGCNLELYEWIIAEARRKNIPNSTFIRKMIERYRAMEEVVT